MFFMDKLVLTHSLSHTLKGHLIHTHYVLCFDVKRTMVLLFMGLTLY